MRTPLALTTVVLAVLAAACSEPPAATIGTGAPAGPREPVLAGERYVALGDSYTGAPGVPDAPTTGCQRSTGNYPAQIAARLSLDLVDVSCGGASTESMTRPQALADSDPQPPQLDALDATTDLVTLRIGGNDNNLYGTLVATCPGLAATQPEGSPCTDALTAGGTDTRELEQAVDEIGTSVEATIELVQQRAPEARLLVIGYPQIVPASGTCAELPLAPGDYPLAASLMERLNAAVERAADEQDVEYVDVQGPSRGHDICAGEDAWVSGMTAVPGRAAAYHPFPEEQAAVADLVVATLG